MTVGYLLDTNIAIWAWDGGSPHHSLTRERLSGLSDDLVYISPVTIAEIEFGFEIAGRPNILRQQQVRSVMAAYEVLPIDRHTSRYYATIRGELFRRHSPRNHRRGLNVKAVEDLIDMSTAKSLGIQENDLWIVALQYDLRLVTADIAGGMRSTVDAAAYHEKTDFWKLPT